MMLAVLLLLAAAQPPLACGGPYIPPTDFDGGNALLMEYAVAQQSAGGSLDALDASAKRLLVQRLCSYADATTCAPLAAAVKIWSHGKTNGVDCAMAILATREVERWRNQLAPDIDEDLRSAIARVLVPTSTAKKKSVVVVLGSVQDMGAPGGMRSTWLMQRVHGALTSLNIDVRDAPKTWNGQRVPNGVSYVLSGTLTERVDGKRQLPVIEISFSSVDTAGARKTAPSFTIPAALAPMAPKALPPPPPPQIGLQVHVETRAGGSLCPGDYTQVHVTNETADPMFVRLFNIDDAGNVLVLFPNEGRVDDSIAGGKSVTISADGFTIEGAPGSRERYVALGAKTPEELGRWRNVRGTCRLAPAEAKKWTDPSALQAPYRTSAGFTLLDDVRCKKPIALPDTALVQEALSAVPVCGS
jgi:hypothetical protein